MSAAALDGPLVRALPKPEDPRPCVRISREMHAVLEQVDRHLGPADPLLFQRAHELVLVVGADTKRRGLRLNAGLPVLRAATSASLLPRMTRHLRFEKGDAPAKLAIMLAKNGAPETPPEWVPCAPTAGILSSFLAMGDYENVRPIVGPTQVPLLRADGTILQRAGYDEASAYLYVPSCDIQEISGMPTQTEAAASLAELQDVFADFPYIDPAAALVPVAALLTVLARPAIDGPTPAFVFDATVRGSGKTLQADVVHGIALGAGGTHTSWPDDEAEQDKILASVASCAAPILILDNVKGSLGGGPIEGVLTLTAKSFRVLGKNDGMRTLPWLAVTMVTGNNMQLSDDMCRRSLVARLESDLEDPTTRTSFRHDLEDLPRFLRANRPRLLRAALTILRAYTAHGCPETDCGRLASYGAWSRLVPQALRFAGGANVLSARPRGAEATTDDVTAAATFVAWLPTLLKAISKPEGASARQILDPLYPPPRRDEIPDSWGELREAIDVLAPARGGSPTAKALGERLRRFRGRWFGSSRLSSRGGHNHTVLWYVDTR